jgi:hypothetical protein
MIFFDMKSLWGKFGYDIFTGFKMTSPQSWDACFLVVLWIEIEIEDLEDIMQPNLNHKLFIS